MGGLREALTSLETDQEDVNEIRPQEDVNGNRLLRLRIPEFPFTFPFPFPCRRCISERPLAMGEAGTHPEVGRPVRQS